MPDHTAKGSESIIRRATLDDYEAIAAVFAAIDQQHANALPGIYRWSDRPVRSRERIGEIVGREDATILVAERHGEIVGLVEVATRQSLDTPLHVPRRVARVETLVVRAQDRRHGIGRALMEAAEEWAQERGCNEIELGVYEFNRPAIALYERLGYTTLSRMMRKSLGDVDQSAGRR